MSRTNEKLNSDLENLGGEYNAYTDFNCTVYSATILNEELENAVTLTWRHAFKFNISNG